MRLYLAILFSCLALVSRAQKYIAHPADTTEIWITGDRGPRFDNDIFKYLNQHIIFPSSLMQDVRGKLIISFIVEKDGKLSNLSINKSVSPLLDSAVLAVLGKTSWQPAKRESYHVRSSVSLHMDLVANVKRHSLLLTRHRYRHVNRDSTDNSLIVKVRGIYPEESMLFYNFLSSHLVYPKDQLAQGKGCFINWEFVVDDNGRITKIHSDGETAEPFKKACLKALKSYRFEQPFYPQKNISWSYFIIFDPKHPTVFSPN